MAFTITIYPAQAPKQEYDEVAEFSLSEMRPAGLGDPYREIELISESNLVLRVPLFNGDVMEVSDG